MNAAILFIVGLFLMVGAIGCLIFSYEFVGIGLGVVGVGMLAAAAIRSTRSG